MSITIGQVGNSDSMVIDGVYDVSVSADSSRDEVTFTGFVREGTLAETKALVRQMRDIRGRQEPITFSADSEWDGFYRINSVSLEAPRGLAVKGAGFRPFRLRAEFIGTDATSEFQTPMTHIMRSNQQGITSDEVNFWHSPGTVGDDTAYDLGNENSPGLITRTGEDGAVVVAVGIADVNPRYRKSPSSFYSGSCYAKVNDYTVPGTNHMNYPASWEAGNTLIKVTPETSGGASTGGIIVSHYDTSAYVDKTYKFLYAGTTKVPEWHAVQVIRANAEIATIQLVRDADESPATFHRHVLELTIRRGSLMVEGRYVWTGPAVNWSVDRDSVEAATAVTPTGASGATGIRATSDDGDGNRYIIGTGNTHTADTTNGGLDFSSVREFTFFIASEINGSSAQTQDTAANQMLQYFGKSNVQAPSVIRAFT